MTDLDFNFIKSVGSKGSGNCQFDGPYDFCFSNSKFYICDFFNQRIQVYSKDFNFVTSFKVEYYPRKIKSTNSTICIVGCYPEGINFYNSNDFHLIRSYNRNHNQNYHHVAADGISQINSMFYEFNSQFQTVSCYDEKGNLKEEINLKHFYDFEILPNTAFIYHNGELFIHSFLRNKIIKLFS